MPIAVLLSALSGGVATAQQAPVPSTTYTRPHTLVAVDGIRRLNLFCQGSGTPTVLLDAGAGENMMVWRHVQGQLASLTRTCSYDRAGYGFSDAATRRSDASAAVDDVHRLIQTAIHAPVVYVGHSLAGIYGTLLVATHPTDVSGVVLVDPSFFNQFALTSASFTPAERTGLAGLLDQGLGQLRSCLALARSGALAKPATKDAAACVDSKGYADTTIDAALRREVERQNGLATHLTTALSEYGSFWPNASGQIIDDQQVAAAGIDFGDRPLVVLTRGKAQRSFPSVSAAHMAANDSAWTAGHVALAARSTRGTHLVIPNTEHHIQFDQPSAVIDAVRQVVMQVRRM
ncbi:MAG: alpha/beta hydrolase [Gemmatimonadota bacterium]